MTFTNKVIWSEGMFLQPHHLQQQDRYLDNLISQHSTIMEAYHWGFTELKIDQHLLALGKLALITARGILLDGTLFDIPVRDDAPPPLEITEGMISTEVFLALPLKRTDATEAGVVNPNAQNNWRYHITTIEINDNNAASINSVPIQIGKLSLTLKLASEDLQGFCYLGIARIAEVHFDRKIILDENYLPPCIDIHTLVSLKNLLQETQGLLSYRGDRLAQRLTQTSTGGTAEIIDFMLLSLINRYEPVFFHLLNLRGLHPQTFYCLLLQLTGELATFTNPQKRPIQPPIYLHADLQTSFTPVINELRRSLTIVLEESAIAIKIEKQQAALWTAPLFDKNLLNTAYFVLAVHAGLPVGSIQDSFPLQSKIAPVEDIHHLVNRALPGIELHLLSVPPREIPYYANFVYFTLYREHPLWQALKHSAAIAFHISGNFPDLQLELWAIKEK